MTKIAPSQIYRYLLFLAALPFAFAMQNGVWKGVGVDKGYLLVLPIIGILLGLLLDKRHKDRWPLICWSFVAVVWVLVLMRGETLASATAFSNAGHYKEFLAIFRDTPKLNYVFGLVVFVVAFHGFSSGFSGVRVKELEKKNSSTLPDGGDQAETGTHGTARFMTNKEASDLLHKEEYGWVLGSDEQGKIYRYNQPGHLAAFCRTRGGKGVSVVIPNLLDYRGVFVCLDPKGENYFVAARRCREKGHRVRVIDPYRITGVMKPDTINVLSFLDKHSPTFVSEVRQMVKLLVDPETVTSSNDPFWPNAAQSMLKMFIIWVVSAPENLQPLPRTLQTVRTLAVGGTQDDTEYLLKLIATNGDVSHQESALLAQQLLKSEKRTNRNLTQLMDTWLQFLGSEVVSSAVCDDGFTIDEILEGKTDLFLCLPLEMLDAEPELSRVILGAIVFALMRARGRMHSRVLLMLDEFPRLGRMEVIVTGLAALGGLGVTIFIAGQSPYQLIEVYGEALAETMLEQLSCKIYFGIEGKYADDAVKQFGETTLIDRSTSDGGGRSRKDYDILGSQSENESESTKHVRRLLMTGDQLRTMGKGEEVLLIAGEHPLKAHRIFYYEHPEFAGTFDENPYVSIKFGGEK